MPKKAGKKKGKKSGGKKSGKKSGGKKGKKGGKKSGASDKEQGPASTGYLFPPPKPCYIPKYNENLLKVLTTHKVEEKELFNMQISIRALDELTPQEIKDLRVVFQVFDSNNDDHLNVKEVRSALRAMGFTVTQEEAHQMVSDYNNDLMMADFNGFLDFVIDKQGGGSDLHDEIVQGFKHFDLDKSGKITLANLKALCREVNLKMTEQELQEMIEEADQNGDNMIDMNEFVRMMQQTSLYS